METEFKEIISILKEAKRLKHIDDFALTGALALSALSQPRATRDVDFLITVDKEKIRDLVDWIKSVKGHRLTKHYIGGKKDLIKDLVEVPIGSTWADLIIAVSDIEKEAVSTGLQAGVFRLRLKIVRPEFLIILKLRAGSDQDFLDCAALWKEEIDREMVKKMAKELFLEGKLKKIAGIARRVKTGK